MESARKVCRAGLKADGYWRERYFPRTNGTAAPGGAAKYCEYPAILVRVVFGNRELFWRVTQARLLRQRHGRWKVCENVWRNGSVHFVVNGISLSVWQAMATIAGGEVVQVPQ